MNLDMSTILDVTIGLIFIFFVFSMFVSGIVELINTLIDQRAKLLRLALDKLLGLKLSALFFNHQLTRVKEQTLFGFHKPINYLSANSFSTVLIDLLVRPGGVGPGPTAPKQTFTDLQNSLANVTLGQVTDLVAPLLAKSKNLTEFQQELDTWYNSYMEQVSGWYKRYTQGVVWGVSLLIAFGMNVDAIYLTKQLGSDSGLRERLVAEAIKATQSNTEPLSQSDTNFVNFLNVQHPELVDTTNKVIKKPLTDSQQLTVQLAYTNFLNSTIDELSLPIGWVKAVDNWRSNSFVAFLGCLLTGAALSFGAPFWFDLLLKLVNIRNTARRPAGNPDPGK